MISGTQKAVNKAKNVFRKAKKSQNKVKLAKQ